MTPLEKKLHVQILKEGPISVARFMSTVVHHYYATRDPFGAAGDFTTAPEISQVFGELIGVWLLDTWQKLGEPRRFYLMELGPGRGTLMSDALRAIKQLSPGFIERAEIVLVESSPTLREAQKNALRDYKVQWVEFFPTLDPLPLFLIANEFFDALPVHQYVRVGQIWRERYVDISMDNDKEFQFITKKIVGEKPPIPPAFSEASPGSIFEYSAAMVHMLNRVYKHIQKHTGAGLIVDYGYSRMALGETLQAVKDHQSVSVLESLGEADITVHVNFQQITELAKNFRLHVSGPAPQAQFLHKMGIEARLQTLLEAATPEQASSLKSGVLRLIEPAQMGKLFKAVAVSSLPEKLAGF